MAEYDLSDWPDWIDAQAAVEKLSITPRTLQRWRINGMIPYSRVYGKCYYRKSDILKMLSQNYNDKKGCKDE